jgi:putative transposase
VGINKFVSASDGNHFGQGFKPIRDKILRRQPGSKGRQRANRERENYIGRTLNQLPWADLAVVGVEKLSDMKRGKNKNRGKAFRKAVAPWLYRRVLNRVRDKAQENRVLLVAVDPANTSRTCPSCGGCNPLNRRGEDFLCIACGHKSDADTIGAQNILARTLATLGSVESPRLERSMI